MHSHVVKDWDPIFKIDPRTRMITNPSGKQKVLIQGDHNSERLTFEMPRYIEGHDMLKCDSIKIYYKNIDSRSGRSVNGEYEIDDLKYHEFINDVLFWSWLVDGNALLYAGALEFMIRFMCTSDDNVDYVWNTADNTEDVYVTKSLAPHYLAAE